MTLTPGRCGLSPQDHQAKSIEQLDEDGLHGLWNGYHTRRTWEDVRDKGGNPDIVARVLDENPAVDPLHALEANRRLVDLLTGRRWYVIRDAREAGATWEQIGAALGMTKQGAQDWYKRKIELQEQHVDDFHDAERARAALAEVS
jgi:hypothetical protein